MNIIDAGKELRLGGRYMVKLSLFNPRALTPDTSLEKCWLGMGDLFGFFRKFCWAWHSVLSTPQVTISADWRSFDSQVSSSIVPLLFMLANSFCIYQVLGSRLVELAHGLADLRRARV